MIGAPIGLFICADVEDLRLQIFYKTKDCQLVCANGGQLDRFGESGSFLCVYVIHFKKIHRFYGIWHLAASSLSVIFTACSTFLEIRIW